MSDTPVPDAPDTGPELHEVFDADRALRTIAKQVAAIFQTLPLLVESMKRIEARQDEHERRIIRLEGIAAAREASP